MKYIDNSYIWGDNWQIEGSNAWFVTGIGNILCRLDLQTKEGELIADIPDVSVSKFRRNSFCMKYQNDLYCMPVFASSIWVYDTVRCKFDEISIDNNDGISINMRGGFWEYAHKIYVVSNGLGQIVEIDPDKKKIIQYYSLCKEGELIKSIKVGDSIFSLSGTFSEIYQFSLETKNVTVYKLPNTGRKVNTICFDGESFWLSGWRKELYIWNREENSIKTIEGFSENFGVYNFSKETDGEVDCKVDEYDSAVFLYSVNVGEGVWFIPYMTNQIVFVNKNTYVLQEFEIKEENETRESILARSELVYKYVLEYVSGNRYIGLYSVKNECILEIDTKELKYEYKQYNYYMSDKFIKKYIEVHDNIFYEGIIWDKKVFEERLGSEGLRDSGNGEEIGTRVYRTITASECI